MKVVLMQDPFGARLYILPAISNPPWWRGFSTRELAMEWVLRLHAQVVNDPAAKVLPIFVRKPV